MDQLHVKVKCFVVIGFTGVTAIATIISGYLHPFLFKSFYNPSRWTIGKSIIHNILLIAWIVLGNAVFDWSMGGRLISTFGLVLLSYLIITPLIGIIPALVSIFIVQNNALKRSLEDAKVINNRLSERLQDKNQVNHIAANRIELTGETKEKLSLYPDRILYIESIGNYVKVNYLLDNVAAQKQIRTTLARMEKELQNYSYVVRCHRAYMVNVLYLVNVRGNSQGLQLNLQYLKEEVPVSRSYIDKIKDKL
jgi:hypothetical protein